MYHLSIPGIVHAIDVASAPVCPVASAIETGASYHQYRFFAKILHSAGNLIMELDTSFL